MLTERYKRRLYNYLRWASMEPIGYPSRLQDLPDDQTQPIEGMASADDAMFEFETHGRKIPCWQPKKLYRYEAGKTSRDFYVSNWVKDVEKGFFVPEEFVCVGGMDIEEFVAVFKRYPDPWLMRRIWRYEQEAIAKGLMGAAGQDLEPATSASASTSVANNGGSKWPPNVKNCFKRLQTALKIWRNWMCTFSAKITRSDTKP
jgi:hypothetical protein